MLYTLSEALKIMDSGAPFSIEWITADRRRNRGGEILFAEGATLLGARYTRRHKEGGVLSGAAPGSGKSNKNPNHYAHGTRNIYLNSGKTRKVHIQLITKLNNIPVA